MATKPRRVARTGSNSWPECNSRRGEGSALSIFSKRAHKESHQRLGHQPAPVVAHVAIHHRDVPSPAHHLSLGEHRTRFHRFQKINLHLHGSHSRPPRTRHVRRQPSRRVSQRREYPAVNHPMNLFVQRLHRHPQRHFPPLRFFDDETKLFCRVARADTFLHVTCRKILSRLGSSRHIRKRSDLHRLELRCR